MAVRNGYCSNPATFPTAWSEVKTCSTVWREVLCSNQKGDLEDRWVEGMYLGLSPTVNDGHVVLRNDGKGNGFVQTLHVRTNLVSPDPPPLEFVGDSLEPEHPPPRFRIKGKQGFGRVAC